MLIAAPALEPASRALTEQILQVSQSITTHQVKGLVSTQWSTANAEIKVPYFENLELTNVILFKHRVGQTIASLAPPTARSFFLVYMFTFLVHSSSFPPHILCVSIG